MCGALRTVFLSPLGGSSERPECSGVRRHADAFGTLERANAVRLPPDAGELGRGPAGGWKAGEELGPGRPAANPARSRSSFQRPNFPRSRPAAARGAPPAPLPPELRLPRAAPPPLSGPRGRARAAAACARRCRRRRCCSGKMNPVCTSAHLN